MVAGAAPEAPRSALGEAVGRATVAEGDPAADALAVASIVGGMDPPE
ncbi:hypothetical protein GCM10009679_56290 [Saccharothrix algeriensis]|uniref:Uncharacterized protein n=1 Tax=Catellatospora bangladeshensis TaxID=310355 RepID=A0A8J3NJ08_9ACTN|nr:hypothetical protein Cba03nite_39810 [Catellatospora bangladeshensis]